jgi:hypothetical protein
MIQYTVSGVKSNKEVFSKSVSPKILKTLEKIIDKLYKTVNFLIYDTIKSITGRDWVMLQNSWNFFFSLRHRRERKILTTNLEHNLKFVFVILSYSKTMFLFFRLKTHRWNWLLLSQQKHYVYLLLWCSYVLP